MNAQLAKTGFQTDPYGFDQVAYRTLIIGDLSRWRAAGRNTSGCEQFLYADPADLTADFLDAFNPDIILSPLMGAAFDVFEVAAILAKLQFKGKYRALCSDIPKVSIVRADVALVAPDLDFDVFRVP